jgi:hypothetical protein
MEMLSHIALFFGLKGVCNPCEPVNLENQYNFSSRWLKNIGTDLVQ